ncbi:hypothetical protein G7Z17_g3630 [Cylindrodendrum hubeiense]|uniref:Arrestin-like N-terminal domain-containing protein n=1 Tax=Cylindrodendrum hubeiense TaxID=595255 RepID=A0A9P5HC52_9HYPO|nr:hypothetical protein G7Z17_g3630 [Cylindrodendrum hubeiense]
MAPIRASLGQREPAIDIKINNHFDSKVYTCASGISGSVVVTPQKDIPFDSFHIFFAGTADTRIDFLQRGAPPSSIHTFLRLKAQVWSGHLPESRIFEAGQTYNVPFAFLVPSELDPRVCNDHHRATEQHQHQRLPPTMGGWDANDQAPEVAKIGYYIKVRIPQNNSKPIESSRPLRVLPTCPEDPPLPLHLAPDNDRYRLTQTKMIRPGLFSSKIGNLRLTATQPNPIMLSVNDLSTSGSSLNLDLEFTPVLIGGVPPEIYSITTRLRSTTFFSLTHLNYPPDLGNDAQIRNCPLTPYSTCHRIPIRQPDELVWERQYASEDPEKSCFNEPGGPRLESPVVQCCLRSRNETRSQPIKYTTTLAIPFKLPTSPKTMFLPTFHSCIISRTYTINLVLATGKSGTVLSLEIPIQVGVQDTNISSITGLPEYIPDEIPDGGMPPPYGHVD